MEHDAMVEGAAVEPGGQAASEEGSELYEEEEGAEGMDSEAQQYDEDGDGREEGEDGEEDEGEEEVVPDYDLRAYGIYQSLPVPVGPPPETGAPPVSAEEYLQRVRHEAAGLPAVVTSAIDPRFFDERRTHYAPHRPDSPLAGEDFAAVSRSALEGGRAGPGAGVCSSAEPGEPSAAWLKDFLADFAALRLNLEEQQTCRLQGLPHAGDERGWRTFCLGSPDGSSDAQAGQAPTLQILMALDQVAVNEVLRWCVSWALERPVLSDAHALWLYSLAARAEKPLPQETSAQMRALLRHCRALRRGIADANDARLPQLNMLIAIAGACFGQDMRLAAMWGDDM